MKPRSKAPRITNATRLVLAASLLLLPAVVPPIASAQVLNLNPEPAARFGVLYLKDRAARIEDEAKQVATEISDTPSLSASVRAHTRATALHLLHLAIADPAVETGPATLYGLRLADALPELDALAAKLPALEASLTDKATPTDKIVAGKLALERLKAMVGKSPASVTASELNSSASIRVYLARHLAPMALLASAIETRPAHGLWLAHPEPGRWIVAPPRDIKSVVARWEQLLGGKRADPLAEITAALVAADTQPDLRARAGEPSAALACVVDVLETLAASSWVTPQARTTVERMAIDTVRDSVDFAKQRSASQRLAMLRVAEITLTQINSLRQRKLEAAPYETLFAAAVNRGELEKPRITDAEGLDWLRRATAVSALTITGPDNAPQQPDLRTVYARADQDWQKRLRELLAAARDVTLRAQAANDPAALMALTTAERRSRDLQCIIALPESIDFTARLQAKPVGGVFRRMKETANNAADAVRDTASAELAEFTRQASLFREFPGEAALRHDAKGDGTSDWPSVGKRGGALVSHIENQRREWANAWASGRNATTAGRAMYTQREAMRTLRDMEMMRGDPAAAAALVTRWPGLSVDRAMLQKEIVAALNTTEGWVTKLLDAGPGDLTERWLDDNGPPAPIRAIASLHFAMASAPTPPASAGQTLAALFDPPPRDAYLRDQLDDAVQFSRLMDEWLFLRSRGSSEPSRAALNKAAARLIAAMDE